MNLFLILLFCTSSIVLFIVIPEKRKRNPKNYQVILANFIENNEKWYIIEFKNIFGKYKPLREYPDNFDEGDILTFISRGAAEDYIKSIVYKDKYKKL